MAYGSQSVISWTLFILIKHVERQLEDTNTSSDIVFSYCKQFDLFSGKNVDRRDK